MNERIDRKGIVELTGASVTQIQLTTNSPQFPKPIGRYANAVYWDAVEVTEWFEEHPIRTIHARGGERLSAHPQLDNDMARAFITGQFGERH